MPRDTVMRPGEVQRLAIPGLMQLRLPFKNDLVDAAALIDHARTVADQDTFVLTSADRIPVRNDRATLNEIVRNVGNKFKQMLHRHSASVHFNFRKTELAHAECVEPDLFVRSAN